MKEKLILHDLGKEQGERLLPPASDDITVFPAVPVVKSCIGCFGCWTKTPGSCVIKDRAYEFPGLMATHKEMIVVSRMVFGGLSPAVKAVLDRSIGYMLPFFQIIKGEMHHVQRYKESPNLKYVFYGEEISEQEKEIAKKLVEANAVNFGSNTFKAVFCNSPEDMEAAIK